MTDKELLALQATATQCRLNVLRMLRASHHGHIGGAFSAMAAILSCANLSVCSLFVVCTEFGNCAISL